MASDTLIQKKRNESKQEIVLRLLEQVEADDSVSQDRFAKRVGIAKGLANAYFNRCLQKGWIRLRQVPKQRFLYYLTPKGFAEKARLTAEFLTSSYQFYRDVRADMGALMADAAHSGHRSLAVLGAGSWRKSLPSSAMNSQVEIVGFIAPNSPRKRIAGRPWWRTGPRSRAPTVRCSQPSRTRAAVFETFRAQQPTVPVLRSAPITFARVEESEMTRWYVVHTQPQAEAKALWHLENQGFDCFLPRIAEAQCVTPAKSSARSFRSSRAISSFALTSI